MSNDNLDEARPKRMRLGTRSCAECRRRKVRCVFPESLSTCEACALHGVPCLAQQPKTDSKPGHKEESAQDLRKRLDEMESIIRQIRGAGSYVDAISPLSGQSHSSNYSDARYQRQTETSSHGSDGLRRPSITQTTPRTDRRPSSDSDSASLHATDALGVFGHTPLVSLFKEALVIPEDAKTPQKTPHISYRKLLHLTTSALPQRILPKDCMTSILNASRHCWGTWPACSSYGSDKPELLNVSDAHTVFVSVCATLWSDDAAATAKSLLWLSLCLFETPRAVAARYPELADPEALIDVYMREAANLLSAASEQGDTLHTVEALCLEMKINIDLGRPRKAWLASRKAVNACLLLGLHRLDPTHYPHEHNIWRAVLYSERQSSLILGFPSSISNLNKPLLPSSEHLSPLDRLIDKIAIIGGAVADRDQSWILPTNDASSCYVKTVELDQDWESCKRFMPDEFWNTEPSMSQQPLAVMYVQQTTKIRYFILGRYIHLPFALKAAGEKKLALSRTACLEASRGVIMTYQTLRRLGGDRLAPCGLMDFESFSAAMVIAFAMLQEISGLSSFDVPYRLEEDYRLLGSLAESLREASFLKDCCTVARRAADALDAILPVLKGQYYPADKSLQNLECDHDITIPFFGRLRIKLPHSASDPSSLPESTTSAPAPPPRPFVEFGTVPFNQDASLNFDFDMELNGDWLPSADANGYDWTILSSLV